jgi:hypothetical protein
MPRACGERPDDRVGETLSMEARPQLGVCLPDAQLVPFDDPPV